MCILVTTSFPFQCRATVYSETIIARTNGLFTNTPCLNFSLFAIFIQIFLVIFRRPDHGQIDILATLYTAIRKGIATMTIKITELKKKKI